MMVLIMAFSFMPVPIREQSVSANNANKTVFQGDNFQIECHIENQWQDGYQASITIQNTGKRTIHNWMLAFATENKIQNIWNAENRFYMQGVHVPTGIRSRLVARVAVLRLSKNISANH